LAKAAAIEQQQQQQVSTQAFRVLFLSKPFPPFPERSLKFLQTKAATAAADQDGAASYDGGF
jgi:hypothetical protein